MKLSVTALLATLAACGGGGGLTGVAPVQVVVESRLEVGVGDDCPSPGPLATIGIFKGAAAPTVVKSGDGTPDGIVSATCSVHADGKEFDVTGKIAVGANDVLRLDGKLTVEDPTRVIGPFNLYSAPMPGIGHFNAYVSDGKSPAGWEETDRACFVRYLTDTQGVAAGRVWGELFCPRVTSTDGHACATVVQFRFEDCAP